MRRDGPDRAVNFIVTGAKRNHGHRCHKRRRMRYVLTHRRGLQFEERVDPQNELPLGSRGCKLSCAV